MGTKLLFILKLNNQNNVSIVNKGNVLKISNKAFTMIELIFIIVLLGILTAVALPKLSATRADAIATTKAQTIVTATSDIVAYSVSQGDVDSSFSVMSNSIENLELSNEAVLTDNKATILIGAVASCITLEVVGSSDKNLTLSFGNANGDNVCAATQSLINLDIYPISLRGTSVVY